MLTRTAAAVRFDLPSTPEQKACSMHLGEGLKTFWRLVEHLQHAADEHQPIHQVEEIIFRELSLSSAALFGGSRRLLVHPLKQTAVSSVLRRPGSRRSLFN